MQVILETEDNFCFISDCRILFKGKLIKSKQKTFCSSENGLCSFQQSPQKKNIFKASYFDSFSLGLIYKYRISVKEDTSNLDRSTKSALL